MYHGKAIKRGVLVPLYNLLKTLFYKVYLHKFKLKPTCKSQYPTSMQIQKNPP